MQSKNNTFWDNIMNNTPNGGKNWKTIGENYTNYFNTTKASGVNRFNSTSIYIGGNWWSDYEGFDTDNDGIGNYNYSINSTYMNDFLPLVPTDTAVPPVMSGTQIDPNVVYDNSTMNCSSIYLDSKKGNVSINWTNGTVQYGVITLLNIVAVS